MPNQNQCDCLMPCHAEYVHYQQCKRPNCKCNPNFNTVLEYMSFINKHLGVVLKILFGDIFSFPNPPISWMNYKTANLAKVYNYNVYHRCFILI